MRNPIVSIVLPVFNAASTLAESLDSVFHQTLTDWELVAVDDGSTDETPGLFHRWMERDSRLRCISQPHRGIVAALNQGIALARGALIARFDADDLMHADRLQAQQSFLELHPEIGLVGSLVEFGGDPSRSRGYALHVDWMNSLITPDAIALNQFIESPFAHPSVMFRRELADQFGGYEQGDFPEDYDLWLRWLEAGVRMTKIPRVLLTWRDSLTRLSRTDQRYGLTAFYRRKARHLARWLKRHLTDSRSLFAWGAGRLTRRRIDFLLAEGIRISGYIDIDPRKIGRCLPHGPVISPQDVPEPGRCFILGFVAKRGARELARTHLTARGYKEGRDFLMAA